jgi:uncharacterized OB-fold protein
MTNGAILPTIDDGNRPFWDGCLEERLVLQRCDSCAHLRYPISPVCPQCIGTSATWVEVDGTGEVYSFGVFRHAYNDAWRGRVPYTVALVKLDAGPTLISNVVGIDPQEVQVGLRVTAVFERVTDDVAIPQFTPLDEGGSR